MIIGIAHNAIRVSDMEKALYFYCDLVGFEKAFEIANPQTGAPWIVYIKICNNAFLELFYGGAKDREKAYDASLIGYHHWCVSVGADLMPGLAQRLFGAGLLKSPEVRAGRDGNASLWIHDPDGNALEFVLYGEQSPHMKSNKGIYDFDGKGYTGIAHLAYGTSDMDKAMDFYCNILGFEKIHSIERDGRLWLNYLRISDGTYLELYTGATQPMNVTRGSAAHGHMCLECDDTAKTAEEIRRKGAPIDVEPKQGSDLNTQAWTHDPDGNRIELMTIHPESEQALASR